MSWLWKRTVKILFFYCEMMINEWNLLYMDCILCTIVCWAWQQKWPKLKNIVAGFLKKKLRIVMVKIAILIIFLVITT